MIEAWDGYSRLERKPNSSENSNHDRDTNNSRGNSSQVKSSLVPFGSPLRAQADRTVTNRIFMVISIVIIVIVAPVTRP